MSNLVETVHKEWAVVKDAPWSFATVFAAVFVLLGGAIWFFTDKIYSSTVSGKDATIEAQKAQIESYKNKLSGASPDQAKTQIEELQGRLATLTQQLGVATRERGQAKQQLSSQVRADNSTPKAVAPLSDDEKQFRNDLRKFILSTLQAHYDAFYGLANVTSGGTAGGPTVSAQIQPRADAAYTLLQDGLTGDFAPSWRELKDAMNTTIDSINVTNTVGLFKKYVSSNQGGCSFKRLPNHRGIWRGQNELTAKMERS